MRKLPYDIHHTPDPYFRESLRRQVLQTAQEGRKMHTENTRTKKHYAITAFGGLFALFAITGGLLLTQRSGDPEPTSVNRVAKSGLLSPTIDPNYDNAQKSSGSSDSTMMMSSDPATSDMMIAAPKTVPFSSIEAASQVIGFKPFYLESAVRGEEMSELYGVEGFGQEGIVSLFMSFGSREELGYQIIQTKITDPSTNEMPPEVERVTAIVDGQQVTGYRNVFWDEQTPPEYRPAGTPRQSVVLTLDNISLEITEYGSFDLSQLQQIAGKLRRF